MDYDVFDQMQDGIYARGGKETQQAYMERILRQVCTQAPDQPMHRINDKLCAAYCQCDAAAQTLTLEFEVQDWMCNPSGTLHGGIMTTAMDMTMGLLARYCKKSRAVVTVQLSVSFLRTVKCGGKFQIQAVMEKAGNRVFFVSGKAKASETQMLAADATAVFM